MGRLIGLALLLWGFAAAATPAVEVAEVAPGIFVRHGLDEDATSANGDAIANIGFIVGATGVAVIDPGGSLRDGEGLRAAVTAHSGLPIRYVLMTHGHPDHVFGAVAFRADHPVFVGSARLAGALAARGEFYRRRLGRILGDDEAAGGLVAPTLSVETGAEIDLGGRVLRLQSFPPAHSHEDLAILDPKTGTLWAGDLLFVGRVPSLDGNLDGWLAALSVLEKDGAVRAVPGHGPVSVQWPMAAADEERYLKTIRDDCRRIIAAGGDIEQAVAGAGLAERDNWRLFDDYNGRNVTEAFRELEWQ